MPRHDAKFTTSNIARGAVGRALRAYIGPQVAVRHLVAAALLAAALTAPAAWTQGQGWRDDMNDVLEELETYMHDAWVAIGSSAGPLADPELSDVRDALEAALAVIDDIQDPEVYPSLNPADAGEIDDSFDPSTLGGYASDCLALAGDAVDEVNSSIVNHADIGARLKTIEHLIVRATPHNYRTKAGI